MTTDPAAGRSLATQAGGAGPDAASRSATTDAPQTTHRTDAAGKAGEPGATQGARPEHPHGPLTGRWQLDRITGPLRGPWPPGRMTGPLRGPWPLGRVISAAVAVTALFSVLAVVLVTLAVTSLSDARSRVVDRLDPAALQVLRLDSALINQETGVRGYALSAQPGFLTPYSSGLAAERAAAASLDALLRHEPAASAALATVTARAVFWRSRYALPTIARVRATGKPDLSPAINQGKAAFDSLRRSVADLQAGIDTARQQGIADLRHAAAVLVAVCAALAAVLLIIVVALAVSLRMTAIRPLSRLAAEAQQVAAGDFGHEVAQSGPREVRDLGMNVNRMRERILQELSALQAAHASLEARSRELQRSNSELEQFAYVASHDLQEPLRKVASFCQLLQRNYAGRLDERADQYIELRRGRRQADAGADQRSAQFQPRWPGHAGSSAGLLRRGSGSGEGQLVR